LNNEYSATVVFADPNYDMALLRFEKTATLRVIPIASEDLIVDKNVIVIGQPQGQRNAITFGEVLKYDNVECYDCDANESNISYQCMYYNARTSNGNSGGMVLDYNYNLVAVVTFGMMDYSGEYIYGAGSPVSKVKEFFANNNFEVGDNNV
jgi:S1-C subfamily serine protease